MSLTRAVPLALALLAAAGAARAQSGVVFGTVRDSAGDALAFTELRVGGRVVIADDAGRFRLAAPAGRARVVARRLGYREWSDSVTIPAGDSVRLDVLLGGRVAIQLEPVISSAAKRSQLVGQAVTGVAVVSETDVARRAVNTVDQAVNLAPAVQMLSGQVNIRGSSGFVEGVGSRVLLLVDGVPATEGDRGGIDWDMVPVEDVAGVEVVKGAGSALYGSAALGGVVNVLTRPLPEGLHGRVTVMGGTYANPPDTLWNFRDFTGGQERVSAAASYGAGPVRGALSVAAYHTDGYRQQDAGHLWQFAGKGEWRPDSTVTVRLSGAWAVHQYQTPLAWCTQGACDDRGLTVQPFKVDVADTGSYTHSGHGYLVATAEGTPSADRTWLARLSWVRTHFTDFQPAGNNTSASDRLGAEVQEVVQAAPDRVLTVGAELAQADASGNFFGTHTQGEYAAYGESEQRFADARLTIGARIDFLSVDGRDLSAVVSPRVGVLFPDAGGAWRASAGRAFRAPSLAERCPNGVEAGFELHCDPGLTSETAWSFELGRTQDVGAARLDAAVFWTEASNLIEPIVVTLADSADSGQEVIEFVNLFRARLAGVDASLTAAPFTPRLTTTASYTYLYARELAHDSAGKAFPERPLAFRPQHLLTLSADYTLGPASVGADFRYSSRFERIELYENDPRVSAQTLDLRASWTSGPWAARLTATNALNYIYNLVPRTLEPVRAVTLSLTYLY